MVGQHYRSRPAYKLVLEAHFSYLASLISLLQSLFAHSRRVCCSWLALATTIQSA